MVNKFVKISTGWRRKKSDLDGFVKSSNSRRANFVNMRRTFRTLNDYEMQLNAEVGLFTKPSIFLSLFFLQFCDNRFHILGAFNIGNKYRIGCLHNNHIFNTVGCNQPLAAND